MSANAKESTSSGLNGQRGFPTEGGGASIRSDRRRLLASLPSARAQTPETLTEPGTFARGTGPLTLTIILAGAEDRSQVTVNAATGVITIEVLAGSATVTLGGTTLTLQTTAVVERVQDPETGAMRITVVSGPDVAVTTGGVTVAVAAGTSTSLLPDGTLAPPALSVEPLPPPLEQLTQAVLALRQEVTQAVTEGWVAQGQHAVRGADWTAPEGPDRPRGAPSGRPREKAAQTPPNT